MKDKIYSKYEAYNLIRIEQEVVLNFRRVLFNKDLNESGLVKLILASNPKPAFKLDLTFTIDEKELDAFSKILEIAGSGIPDTDVLRLVERIRQLIK